MQEFSIADKVMVRVSPERFPPRTIENIHARCIGPYRVLRKTGPNAYELNISRDLSISPVFDGKDLTWYSVPVDYPATILDSTTFAAVDAPRFSVSLPPPVPSWRHQI